MYDENNLLLSSYQLQTVATASMQTMLAQLPALQIMGRISMNNLSQLLSLPVGVTKIGF